MKLTFYGGARSVTGANYLLEAEGIKILVDCGFLQGSRYAEHQNFEPFPYSPQEIAAVFVTHAHIDHTGRLPRLYRNGFRGAIYSTPPTRAFAELLLLDSEGLLGKEAARDNHAPCYTTEDVKGLMNHWDTLHYHESLALGPFRVTLYNAGHILGSATVSVEVNGKKIVFSGDLGNYPTPIIQSPETVKGATYCLMESTYGDRVHEQADQRRESLEDAIEDVAQSSGTLLIPAFAMERTQELLFYLNDLVEHGRIPPMPIFIDSPLAIRLTEVYKKYENYFNNESKALIRSGDDILNFPGLRFTLTTEASKEINHIRPPKIIIAGSGMSQGGRILHHELRYLPDPHSMILFIGYQGMGSLGRQILDGAKEITIFGETIPVKARVRQISGYSAHADQPRLLAWLHATRETLKKVFVVQGEEAASETLAQKIRDELAVHAVVPHIGEEFEL